MLISKKTGKQIEFNYRSHTLLIEDKINGMSSKYLVDDLCKNIDNSRCNIYLNDNELNYEKLKSRYADNEKVVFIDPNNDKTIKINPFLGDERDIAEYILDIFVRCMKSKDKYKNNNMFDNMFDMIQSYIRASIYAIKRVLGDCVSFENLYKFWGEETFNQYIIEKLITLEDENNLSISNKEIYNYFNQKIFYTLKKYYGKDILDIISGIINNDCWGNVFSATLYENNFNFVDIFDKKLTVIINTTKSEGDSETNCALDYLLIHCIEYAILHRNNANLQSQDNTIYLYMESPERFLSQVFLNVLVMSSAYGVSCITNINNIKQIEEKYGDDIFVYLNMFNNKVIFPDFNKNDLEYVLRELNNKINIINIRNSKMLSYYKGLLQYIKRKQYKTYPLIKKEEVIINKYIYCISNNHEYELPELCIIK